LKVYRQAVLKKAFEGELTKEWRERQKDLPTADELLEQIKKERQNLKLKLKKLSNLTDVERNDLYKLPPGWNWACTDNLSRFDEGAICAGPFGTIFKAKDFRDKGIPIIFLRHVKPNNYNANKPGFMDKDVWEKLFKSYSVYGGELLITKLGEPPGICAIYPEGIGPAMVTPDVIKMSVNEKCSSKKFLMYYFNSVLSKRQYEKAAFGTTRLRVTIPIFRKLPIPLCSLPEQHQIVREIESRLSVCDKVEQNITEALEKSEALRQSILKKAFEGKLLSAAEIAKCKKEADYEPASELLKKIKMEKKK
jgi:type I restriction enzyme, S subunit